MKILLTIFIFLLFFIILINSIEIKLCINLKTDRKNKNQMNLNQKYFVKKSELNNIYLKIYIFKKILIFKIDLIKKINKNKKNPPKNKLMKKILNKKITEFSNNKFADKIIYLKKICELIKKCKIYLEEFKTKIEISTTDAILDSMIVFILSNIIVFIIKFLDLELNFKNNCWKIQPLYSNKKVLNIDLNCIITINLVDTIIVILKNIKKWRCDDNGNKKSN